MRNKTSRIKTGGMSPEGIFLLELPLLIAALYGAKMILKSNTEIQGLIDETNRLDRAALNPPHVIARLATPPSSQRRLATRRRSTSSPRQSTRSRSTSSPRQSTRSRRTSSPRGVTYKSPPKRSASSKKTSARRPKATL